MLLNEVNIEIEQPTENFSFQILPIIYLLWWIWIERDSDEKIQHSNEVKQSRYYNSKLIPGFDSVLFWGSHLRTFHIQETNFLQNSGGESSSWIFSKDSHKILILTKYKIIYWKPKQKYLLFRLSYPFTSNVERQSHLGFLDLTIHSCNCLPDSITESNKRLIRRTQCRDTTIRWWELKPYRSWEFLPLV